MTGRFRRSPTAKIPHDSTGLHAEAIGRLQDHQYGPASRRAGRFDTLRKLTAVIEIRTLFHKRVQLTRRCRFTIRAATGLIASLIRDCSMLVVES